MKTKKLVFGVCVLAAVTGAVPQVFWAQELHIDADGQRHFAEAQRYMAEAQMYMAERRRRVAEAQRVLDWHRVDEIQMGPDWHRDAHDWHMVDADVQENTEQ
jgi:hypothetical protein